MKLELIAWQETRQIKNFGEAIKGFVVRSKKVAATKEVLDGLKIS